MSARPMYVGVGSCDCKRMDVRLYQVPQSGTRTLPHLMCGKCLESHNIEVPRPRTADDLEMVDGVLKWKQ